METLLQDIRYAIRTLTKKPGFAIVAVLTLGLVLGANTTIFSIVDNILLRSLPYPRPEQLVDISAAYLPALPKLAVATGDFNDWKRGTKTLSALEANSVISYGANLTGDGEPQRVQITYATAGFFPMVGIRPAAGREFYPQEDKFGNAPIALLSHDLWQSRYGADPNVVGRTITLDSKSYTITGVLPAGFKLFRKTDLWMPLGLMPEDLDDHVHHRLTVFGRKKPEYSLEQVQAEFTELNHQEAIAYPAPHKNWTLNVQRLEDPSATNLRRTLLMLTGAVGLVLLIACANIANLLLVRNAAREREFAVRTALGAGAWRLVRQLLTESLLVSLAGGLFGLLLAFLGLRVVASLVPPNAAVIRNVSMNATVFGFALLACGAAGVFCSILPAAQILKTNVNSILKSGGLGATGTGRARLHKILVVSEISMALVPLLGAGLLLRSFEKVLEIDPGFRPDHLLTMEVQHAQLSPAQMVQLSGQDRAKLIAQESQQFSQIVDSVEALPGVKSAGGIDVMPINHGLAQAARFLVEGEPIPTNGAYDIAEVRSATVDYFKTVGVPLMTGRLLTKDDGGGSNMLVNDAMARRYWRTDGDAIGKRVNLCPLDKQVCFFNVVGVVGNVRQYGLDGTSSFDTYTTGGWTQHLLVRSETDPAALSSSVTQAIHKVDPTLPIINITTIDEFIADSTSPRRFTATLISGFAIMALLLAAVGVYGVMSYSVSQRTQEIGIRMAMGAQGEHVRSMILKESLAMALFGVALGLGAASLLVRFLASLLFNVGAYDPLTFTAVAMLLVIVAMVASYVPARRAVRVDPMMALRSE